jgi:adenylate cyclase
VRFSPRTRIQFLTVAVAVPAAALVGMVYDWLSNDDLGQAVTTGGVIGAVICSVLLSLHMFGAVAAMRRRLRALPFGVHVAASVLLTLLVVLFGIAVGQVTGSLYRGAPVEVQYRTGDVVFSLAASALFVAATTLDRVLGGAVLLGLLSGRYASPRQEERVFLFADVAGSTALAERIGDVAFHRFLDRLFTELSDPVARNRGSIYRYVGDEMIVTWPLRGPRDARRALACVLDCQGTLAARRRLWQDRYGQVPELRYVLHAGPVVTGEMGDLKREVVFLGDTVNTAARMEQLAKARGRQIVLSEAVLRHLELPPELTAVPLDDVVLRGKTNPVRVYAVVPAEAADPGAAPAHLAAGVG